MLNENYLLIDVSKRFQNLLKPDKALNDAVFVSFVLSLFKLWKNAFNKRN